MGMLNKDVREATPKKFEDGLVNPVSLIFITQEPGRLILPDQIKGQECLFAKESPRVRGEMVEATEFPHLAQR